MKHLFTTEKESLNFLNLSKKLYGVKLLNNNVLVIVYFLFSFSGVSLAQERENIRFWQAEPFGKEDQSKELVEKRDAYSKHFKNDNGTITAHIASGPINYLENGQWKTIYHTISPTANGFENVHNSHKTYFPATASGSIQTILPNGAVVKDMLAMRMYYQTANGEKINTIILRSLKGIIILLNIKIMRKKLL